jgi:hypothetical protein
MRAALVSEGANNRIDPGWRRSNSAAHARCRLPVASIAITGPAPGCAASSDSRPSSPVRDTGNEVGLSSKPVPSLTQTRFITFPGSTATTTVAGSTATPNTDMRTAS